MVFQRYEFKYLMTRRQQQALLAVMEPYMVPDAYSRSSIRNLYLDTPDFRLIRRSLERPAYKEKLRIRSYGRAGGADPVFVELKKKYLAVVYKRRLSLPQEEALAAGLLLCAMTMWCAPFSRSLTVTLAILPAVVCVVIMMVNGNVGTGVAISKKKAALGLPFFVPGGRVPPKRPASINLLSADLIQAIMEHKLFPPASGGRIWISAAERAVHTWTAGKNTPFFWRRSL